MIELGRYSLEPNHIYHGTDAIPAALHKAMDEYAKQQALAFAKFVVKNNYYEYTAPSGDMYDEFIEQQSKDNGNKGEG